MRTEKIMTSKKKLIALLEKKYPDLVIFEDGNGWISKSEKTFAVSSEDRVCSSNGYDLMNYWTQNYDHYEFGVHSELVEFLSKHGWYGEWCNPGVLGIVQDI